MSTKDDGFQGHDSGCRKADIERTASSSLRVDTQDIAVSFNGIELLIHLLRVENEMRGGGAVSAQPDTYRHLSLVYQFLCGPTTPMVPE
jgi:hypothetical protein